MRELLQLAAKISIQTETAAFALTAANRALQQLKAGKINGVGVSEIGSQGKFAKNRNENQKND